MRRFIAELRRRHVLRVAAVYLVAAWAMIEVSATTFPMLNLPDWSPTLVLALLAVGFPIVVALTWAFDITAQGVVRTRRTVRADAAARSIGRAATRRGPAPDPPRPGTLAVLPFADLSQDRDQDYLADGIAEEILNVLASVEQLGVAARTSSFAFKGRHVDVREIGRQLGVDLVLEGSVRTAGDRLRVTAQLISVEDGLHVWSRRFERDMADVFAVQDEIAAEIASALGVAEPTPVSARSATHRIEAYEAYLRGRQLFHRKTGRSLHAARALFEQAIALDPSYAPAWAGLADTSSFLFMYWEPNDAHRRAADQCSLAALEHGEDLAEAHVSRGLAHTLFNRFTDAERRFGEAIAMNPRLYEAWYFSARMRFTAGDMKGAAEHFRRAAEIQPEQYDTWGILAQVYSALGDAVERERAGARAVEAAERTLRFNPEDVRALYFLAGALVNRGEVERGLEMAERAAAMEPDDPAVHYNVACAFSSAGRIEQAVEHLERAAALGYRAADWMEQDAELDNVRTHPRYAAVVATMRAADRPFVVDRNGEEPEPPATPWPTL